MIRGPGETGVKSFDYKDKPIHSDYVNEFWDGWRYTAAELRSIRLFEMADPDVENCRLVFRARLKTAQATEAYLRMTARLPDGNELDTEARRPLVAEGDSVALYMPNPIMRIDTETR